MGEIKVTDENDRRLHERMEICWPVTIYCDDEEIEGESKNMSADGLYVCSVKPLPFNKSFKISINPPNHQAMGLEGKVIWSDLYGIDDNENKDVCCIGICLLEMSNEDRKQLKEVLMDYL
jgi:hypothetical protein